ncbi:MAG: tRNA 2-thiocytidine biosynthesis TtcA family protein, partial [Mailhella sp.]|nr:tRNA 2-thiocytidine biosynthesis TtcA family protein [Mailhella sp.]
MKCTRCKAPAIIDLPSHNAAFCRSCFIQFFEKQVQKGIEQHNLLEKNEKVLVALSGGKDSLALALVLSRLGYAVTGLHIDLSIGISSEKARAVVERFCRKHGIPLIMKEMEKEGLAIPKVKARLNRPICSACGKIKRYYFNQTARDLGFDALATGHNLDDETARLTSNTLSWDRAYLSDQGPVLPDEEGFRKKIKPLWRLSEYETAHYAFLMDIEN